MTERTLQYAFVTTIFGGDTYVGAALVLAQSLRQHKTRARLIIIVAEDVSANGKDALKKLYDAVISIQSIEIKLPAQRHGGKRFQHMYQWLPRCFTKFRAFQLEEVDGIPLSKICLLDADMFAVANPDRIFELQTPAGICSRAEDSQALHGRRIPEALLRASMNDYGIRGCLLLLTPSREEFTNIFQHIYQHPECLGDDPTDSKSRPSYIGPDERMLTRYYWKKWIGVSSAYGCTSWKTNGIRPIFLHFVSEKPWNATQDWPDFRLWWKVADDIVTKKGSDLAVFFPRSPLIR